MPISKDAVLEELDEFLRGFHASLSRVYGPSSVAFAEPFDPRRTSLSETVAAMYDYGVRGHLAQGTPFRGEGTLDPAFADAEMFLVGLGGLDLYLDEAGVRMPAGAVAVAATAVARHVLDGGDRFSGWEDSAPAGYLSLKEIALLADMDEGSVRNAAHSTKGDLKVEKIDKRSVVAVEEARRWLAGRRGFKLTQVLPSLRPDPSVPAAPFVTDQTLREVAQRAAAAGMSLDAFLRDRLLAN